MVTSGVCNDAVRVGGFGPMYRGHLTTCFNDTVLIPIPNFLLVLVGLPVVLAAGTTMSKTWRHRWFDWLLDVLVVAALCMNILEIVRLALSNSGIGLLPTALAGILVALFMSFLRRTNRKNAKVIAGVLAFYWALLVAFESIKVDELHRVENEAKVAGSKGPTKYPNSDKSLDNYVILGLYCVFFLSELVNLVFRGSASRRHGKGTTGSIASENELDGGKRKLMSNV